MRSKAALLVLVALAGACTQYHYVARTTQLDSTGQERELVAMWQVTRRKLWYDGSSEGIVLKLQCSTATMDFEEQPEGIVMRSDGTWSGARGQATHAICGQVEGVEHVKDLGVGDSLTLQLWCEPAQEDEFALPTPYLPAGSYSFAEVKRQTTPADVATCPAPATSISAR